jgi:hypothetical protein
MSRDLAELFAALAAILPHDLVEVAREGHRRSGEVLPIIERNEELLKHLHCQEGDLSFRSN